MKKYFKSAMSVLLCLSMCLGFFACTEQPEPAPDTTEADPITTAEDTTAQEETTEMDETTKAEEKEETVSLDGKRVIFIGNSYVYYGRSVLGRSTSIMTQAERENDKG